jgi:uncharacterized damage-inducible protein DinB
VAGAKPVVHGASNDRISTARDVASTARVYGVAPTMVDGLAHMMMLERHWLSAAEPLLAWLEREVVISN